ncbi:DNA primase [Patescibacteria group bacterium]|nr:DNA primase [Patescibacteria group bacterium]
MLNSPIEEIKNRLDIVQVIGEYLKLQKAGASYRALCPFHSEKGPSFFVSPARQMYHCFGCSVGGDIFQFVMQIEGMEFGDALRLLAQKAGVELSKTDPAYARMQSERKQLQEILELASKFFIRQLESQQGLLAKEYLKSRGVFDESFRAWSLGYAPDTKRTLLDFLLEKGHREEEINRAGLLVRTDTGVYDRFRSRIMFPVFNLQGEVIGFGGRIFGTERKDLAKYVNTPATSLYDKGRILYGLDKAKLEMRKQDSCILVEGYMDVILVAQTNAKNVVATSGTALTLSHLQLLKRYSENLLLAFDMDIAGDSATKRGIELALSEGFNVKIVRLLKGKDPADIVKEDPALFEKALLQASSIIDYYFETAFSQFDKTTAEGKKKAGALLLHIISKLPNKIEQTHWIQRLAVELGVKEEAVFEELSKVKKEPGERQESSLAQEAALPVSRQGGGKGRRGLIEERILILLFRDPENLKKLKEEDIRQMSTATQEIVIGLKKAENLDFSSLEKIFPETNLKAVKHIALLADLEEEEEGLEDEFHLCLKSLVIFSLKERLEEIIQKVKKAEGAKEGAKLDLLLQEFHEITKELSN